MQIGLSRAVRLPADDVTIRVIVERDVKARLFPTIHLKKPFRDPSMRFLPPSFPVDPACYLGYNVTNSFI